MRRAVFRFGGLLISALMALNWRFEGGATNAA